MFETLNFLSMSYCMTLGSPRTVLLINSPYSLCANKLLSLIWSIVRIALFFPKN